MAKKQTTEDQSERDAQVQAVMAMEVSKREKFARLHDLGLTPSQIKDATGVSYAQVYVGLRTRTWFPDQPAKPRGRKAAPATDAEPPAKPARKARAAKPAAEKPSKEEVPANAEGEGGDEAMQTFLKNHREGKRAERRRQQSAKTRLAAERADGKAKPKDDDDTAGPSEAELAEIERESGMHVLP